MYQKFLFWKIEIYKILLRTLIYLSYTRSDIAYTMNVINQLVHNPKEDTLTCGRF